MSSDIHHRIRSRGQFIWLDSLVWSIFPKKPLKHAVFGHFVVLLHVVHSRIRLLPKFNFMKTSYLGENYSEAFAITQNVSYMNSQDTYSSCMSDALENYKNRDTSHILMQFITLEFASMNACLSTSYLRNAKLNYDLTITVQGGGTRTYDQHVATNWYEWAQQEPTLRHCVY